MRPRLARGTPWFVPVLCAAPLVVRGRVARPAAAALAGAVAWFFRDPDRDPDGPGLLAPADGVVRGVERYDGRWAVSTYLDLRDVHVTRAPVAATVLGQERRSGGHAPAYRPTSDHNHRLVWRLRTTAGDVDLVQYAGLLARRIVAYHGPGDGLERGERIGLIRFGSRVDLVLPTGVTPCVVVGQRVRGGATVLAGLPSPVDADPAGPAC